jgi:two-component system sensor histidine kinase KdpD
MTTPDDRRADPDELLRRVEREEALERRGRLKVFLGAAPGVGKTFAMLDAARRERDAGTDLVIGFVETHGRAETGALLEGLETLPRRTLTYRERTMEEFDLDAALKRRPALILVDELAHTNVPGSRHVKRWQDIEELLEAGLDVWTTLNIQHLESLNDTIAQITSVRVRETLPDKVLEQADDLELIDLPPDELIERLREGKVYPPEAAQRAEQSFFRKGNLLALREIALRRAAEKVDAEVQAHRREAGIGSPWATSEHVLVCVSGGRGSAALIRAGRRLADRLAAKWTVAHVEVPARGSEDERAGVRKALRLAEELGAEVVTLSGHRPSDEVLAWARTRNVTRLVVGRSRRPRLLDRLAGSFLERLVRGSGDVDVLVVSGEGEDARRARGETVRVPRPLGGVDEYLRAAAAVGVATAVSVVALPYFEIANLVMVYLLAIVFVALRGSRGASLFAAAFSVGAFDFFCVPPRFTFAVSDVRYLVTFFVMFVVGVVISGLTVRIREQAEASRLKEQRTAALYWLTRELAKTSRTPEIVAAAQHSIERVFEGRCVILLPGPSGDPEPVPEVAYAYDLDETELGAARYSFHHREPTGVGTATLPGAKALYLPLASGAETLGVVGLKPLESWKIESPEQRVLLATFCRQTAVALERARLAEEAHDAERRAEREELRNSLLSSVSHDLRTPLAAITGAATALLAGGDGGRSASGAPNLQSDEGGRAVRRELLETIAEEAGRLNRLVGNLLDMTRLEAGGLEPKKEWTPLEEVIGAALARSEPLLRGRAVRVDVPQSLPLVPIDGVLVEQVLLNLIENAAKYTPKESPLEIAAFAEPGRVAVEVRDRGPGISDEMKEAIFEKFVRGRTPGQPGGTGLGLAIARGIALAHGGAISVSSREGGGAAFRLTVPIEGTPPAIEREEEVTA